MLQAGRGLLALLTGDRGSARYFDLGPRGLTGALIGFLAVEAILAYVPALMSPASPGGVGTGLLVSLGVAAIPVVLVGAALQTMGRTDGFVPFLVADFWASAYLTLAGVLLLLVGAPYLLVMTGLAVVVIVVEVNIARLIVKLRPLQVVGLIVAQLLGGLMGLMLWGTLLGPQLQSAVPA